MLGNVYVLIDDKKRVKYTQTFYEENKSEFTRQNNDGWGIYCSVNCFEATEEQMAMRGKKTARNIEFLTKINAVFADLDIAKSGDGQTREQRDAKIQNVIKALEEICPPSKIIYTANGIQPLRLLDSFPIDPESQKKYIQLINGIIERSKTIGCAGDDVKDVTRIVRVPGYYHMKNEPFMVYLSKDTEILYRFEDIETLFKKYIPQRKEYRSMELREEREYKALKQFDAIDRLNFQEVIVRAFSAIRRSAEFDSTGRLILDGRLTGTFQGRNGDRRYLASGSHEPYKGNIITAVGDILQVSNKEAYKWLLEEFKIKTETELTREQKKIEKKEEKKIEQIEKAEITKTNFKHISAEDKIMRGYEELVNTNPNEIMKRGREERDELLGGIYGGKIYLIGANTGVGKSTFCNQVAQNVSRQGFRVVKYSLEDRIEDTAKESIYFLVNKMRYSDGKPKYLRTKFMNNEYRNGEFSRYVLKACEMLLKEKIIELDKDKQVSIDDLVVLMGEECKRGTRLFVIDHLHYFEFDDTRAERLDLQIQNVMHKINEIARKNNVAVLLVAHYRNNTPKMKAGDRPDPSWFRDASAIKQVANVIVQIDRDVSLEDGSTRFYFTKLRGPIKNVTFDSVFDIDIFGYDFKKNPEQLQKDTEFMKQD